MFTWRSWNLKFWLVFQRAKMFSLWLSVPSSITKQILVACVSKMAGWLSVQASSGVMREMSLLTEDDWYQYITRWSFIQTSWEGVSHCTDAIQVTDISLGRILEGLFKTGATTADVGEISWYSGGSGLDWTTQYGNTKLQKLCSLCELALLFGVRVTSISINTKFLHSSPGCLSV